jgi:hypothetical protein
MMHLLVFNFLLSFAAASAAQPVKDFIYKTYGDFHEAVLDHEAHAWLMSNEEDLAHDGFDTGLCKETLEKLKAVFAGNYKE